MTDKIRVSEYEIFCGIDTSKSKLDCVFVDWKDKVRRVSMPNDGEMLLRFVKRNYPGKKILFVYEAGPTGCVLYDFITAAGHRCVIAAPSMVPTARGARVKTNRLDALNLVMELRGGRIKGNHVPSEKYRDLRHLTQFRDVAVKEVGRRQKRIKSLLLVEGIEFPGERWSRESIKQLEELSCRQVVKYKIAMLLKSMEHAIGELRAIELELQKYYRADEELSRCTDYLMSVDGVGWKTAVHFLARVGDWRQLGSCKETCGFLGLGASEFSTGERVVRGGITAVGDRRLRAKLIQIAWVAIHKDTELKAAFDRIYRNNPAQYAKKKAIVAVARKLVARMHAVLRDQRFYL